MEIAGLGFECRNEFAHVADAVRDEVEHVALALEFAVDDQSGGGAGGAMKALSIVYKLRI